MAGKKVRKPGDPPSTESRKYQKPVDTPLDPQEQVYVFNRLLGDSQMDAHLKAWPESDRKEAHKRAYLREASPHIAKFIEARKQELTEIAERDYDLSRERLLKEAAQFALGDIEAFQKWESDNPLRDKGDWFDRICKFLGHYQQKVDVTSGGKPILTDSERMEKIIAIAERARSKGA